MPETIAITPVALRDENNEVAASLKEQGYRVLTHPEIVPPTRAQQTELIRDAVGIILGPERFGRDVMEEAPHLRVISRYGVGYDNIDLDAAAELGIVVTYVPDAMVESVADLTLGLMLSVARRISELDASCKRGEWRRLIGADVSGRTLGLVGTGRIGMAVARRARAFKMRLIGYDPYPSPLFVEELGGDYLALDELLGVADFVTLHSPATPETRGMIGATQLALMKPSAFLINAARGSLVDEPALIAALRENKIAGAGLDVFAEEPPTPSSPSEELLGLPNVVATPHVASFTPITVAKMARAALANLLAVLGGERPENVANPAVYERGLRESG